MFFSMELYNAQPIRHSLFAVTAVYSDASSIGYGGFAVEHCACVMYGQWTVEEAHSEFHVA